MTTPTVNINYMCNIIIGLILYRVVPQTPYEIANVLRQISETMTLLVFTDMSTYKRTYPKVLSEKELLYN